VTMFEIPINKMVNTVDPSLSTSLHPHADDVAIYCHVFV
jgi:hypothetical protein